MYSKINITPNYFPGWWCNNINKYMLDNIQPSDNLGKKGVRRCDVRPLIPTMKPYNDIFKSLIDYAKQNAYKIGVDLDFNIDGPCIQHITYLPGHYVGWHNDTLGIGAARETKQYESLTISRKASLTVILSDPSEYTGGNFVFEPGFNLETKVEGKGTVALFTSHSQHKVEEITSGRRNILFIFLTGPEWR